MGRMYDYNAERQETAPCGRNAKAKDVRAFTHLVIASELAHMSVEPSLYMHLVASRHHFRAVY
jgi:hypothetical protein